MSAKDKIIYGCIGAGIAFVAILIIGIALVYDDLRDSVFKIATDSMYPAIQKDEYVEVDKYFPYNEIIVGDIIMFHPPNNPEKFIVHRVATIIDEEPLTLRLKGDANPSSIENQDYPIMEENYVGKILRIYPDTASIETGENVRYP